MQPDREHRDLTRKLAAFRRRGAARYPTKLRAQVAAWVIAKRDRGQWWTEISAALGIPTQTLVRWAATFGAPVRGIKMVEVIDAPPIDTVTIVTSIGLRVEGVAINAAIAILRGIA